MSDKELIRDSLILHLQTLKDFGVRQSLLTSSDLSDEIGEAVAKSEKVTPPSQVSATQTLEKVSSLEALQNFIGDCQLCKLCQKRTNLVFGIGNPHADLMFVGEGPGADEDQQGEPFVGRAGQLLTKMIKAMGFSRDDVYIANVVKCRPPNNRNPEPDEVEMCSPFLQKQIELVKPKVIVALGKFAAQTMCETVIPISKLRGQFREIRGIQIMPTFHPSYLLRNPEMKRPVWEDLKKVMGYLGS